jgi:8-oxo-dGTP diphosphatase
MWSLLPEKFTLSELQAAYETVLSKPLDKRNFRKKILALGLVTASGEKSTGRRHRPAMLYRFESKTPELVEVF